MGESYKQQLVDVLVKMMEKCREFEYPTLESDKQLAHDNLGEIAMLCQGISLQQRGIL